MPAFMLPESPCIVRPHVEEDIAAPEFVADGAVIIPRDGVFNIVYFRRPLFGSGARVRQALTVVLSREGFDLTCALARAEWDAGVLPVRGN